MARHYVVMADVINSRTYRGDILLPAFQHVVRSCNDHLGTQILSPFTITLGDEFQGIVDSFKAAVDTIFYMEEALLTLQPAFRIRYVVVHGDIETDINPIMAYGMTGRGLIQARELLTRKWRGKPRFQFVLDDEVQHEFNLLFRLVDSVSADWKFKDYALISHMIAERDDKIVAEAFKKDRSQIWKRRKSLRIEEYFLLKDLVYHTVQDHFPWSQNDLHQFCYLSSRRITGIAPVWGREEVLHRRQPSSKA